MKAALSAFAGLFNLLPGWLWALVAAGALAAAGMNAWELRGERLAHADTRTEHAEQIARMAGAAVRQESEFRRRENALADRILQETYEADQELEAARADAAAAHAAGQRLRSAEQRLREQLAALAATSCGAAAAAGAATPSPAAQEARNLLADVQRRLDQATDDIARFADAASTAGALCERVSDRTRETLNAEMPHGPEIR